MFRSYDRPHFKKDESEWLFNAGDASIAKVWEVARATSAAPRYFSKHTIDNGTPGTYIDGGMGCNNPADLMAQEVDAIHGRVPELIISVGTGTKPPMQHGSPQQFNTREHKFLNNARSVFGVLKKLPDIVTASEDCHVGLQKHVTKLRQERSRNLPNSSKYPMYSRFNVTGLGTIKLDAWESTDGSEEPDGAKTLRELEAKTRAYLNTGTVRKSMEACAKELVLMRRERARTERWEQFATHTTYRCPLREEHECADKLFSNREQLRSHAAERHEFVPWISIQERRSSNTNECPEDSYICIMDQCAEAPQLFRGADAVNQMLRHLQGPAHNIKNPEPKSKPGLEEYLDQGRTTLDAAFQEVAPVVSREQPDPAQQPPEGHNAGVNRTRWELMSRLRRRMLSRKIDSQLTEQSASNIAGSFNSSNGEAGGRSDDNASTSQQQQPQHQQPQAPISRDEHSARAEPLSRQIDHAADHHNCNTTDPRQNQARRPSVQQSAGAEQFSEHNGSDESPVDHEQIYSGRPLVPDSLFPSIDRATKHILHRRVQSI